MTNIKCYCDICGREIGLSRDKITLKPDGLLWHDYEFCGRCYRKAKRGFKAVIKELKNEPIDEVVGGETDGWIDTRKFKPQISGNYLVHDGIVQMLHFDATKGRFYAHWWSDILCTERFPTHWMPMPDAPKEVHDAEE